MHFIVIEVDGETAIKIIYENVSKKITFSWNQTQLKLLPSCAS